MRTRFAASLFVGALVGLAPVVGATERLVNRFDTRHGLPVTQISSLAQDSRGFIWIGTLGGLVRFDGTEMKVWSHDRIPAEVSILGAGPGGTLIVGTQGLLYELAGGKLVAVGGSEGPVNTVTGAVFGEDGRLWIVADGVLRVRGRDGRLRVVPQSVFAGERLHDVRRGRQGELLVLSGVAVWEFQPGPDRARRTDLADPIDATRGPDGALVALTYSGDVGRVMDCAAGGTCRAVLELAARPIALARRGETIWASFDRYLAAVRPRQPNEILGLAEGIPSGGPLLVDAEGSLWLGTLRGLLHYPEPDTVAWSELDGLPSAHARYLSRDAEGLWVATWQGLGRLEATPAGWKGRREGIYHHTPLCRDGAGRLLVLNQPDGPLYVRIGGRFESRPIGVRDWLDGCSPAFDGGVWYAMDRHLLHIGAGGGPIRAVVRPAVGSDEQDRAVLEDRRGTLWLGRGEYVCHSPVGGLVGNPAPAWSCDRLAGSWKIVTLAQTPKGRVWAGTQSGGVWHYHAGRWDRFGSSASLASPTVRGLQAGSDGSIWLLGAGSVMRVRERDDPDEGWTPLERLTSFHGLTSEEAQSVVDGADGTVWIATNGGVIRVPSTARFAPMPPPRVELVSVLADGREVPDGEALSLPPGRNSLELRFAFLSFRDRSRLHVQTRVDAGQPWADAPAREAGVRFLNTAPGRYTVEVRASLDEIRWSTPASFSFEARQHWYLTWRALTLAMIAGVALLWAGHRMRVAVAMRLAEQRAGIAMDLHDELGAGLGAIGLLAGVASSRDVDDLDRRRLATTIADTAGELGAGLSDLVWALRAGPATLATLAAHLADRGSRLFPGPAPEFATDFPQAWPDDELPLRLNRNVLLICLEALRNAARHAHASHVGLRLAPERGHWILEVQDDGCGMGAPAGSGGAAGGHGLRNIRERAAEIGGAVEWTSRPGAGTSFRLTFDVGARRGGQT